MSGYYEYEPQIELARPTVVTGYLTDFTRAVTYRASSLLGLPYHDIDRLVEHDVAMEITRLVSESGEDRLRQVESQCLEKALVGQPAGLIALGDGGLLAEGNRDRVEADGDLIVLDFEMGNLLWRAQHRARRLAPAPWHPLVWEIPATVADIRPYFQARQPGFEQAEVRIPASSLSVAQACEALMGQLDELAS